MGKALKAVGTAIVIVGAVVATGGAALIPALAGGGIAGAMGTALFGVTAGQLLTIGSLVSSIGGALSQPKVSTAGNALGWVGDPNGPMHFAAGRIAVGGDLRHKGAYGPNDRMYFSAITVVSDAGPIDAFESFTANDIPVTFDGSGKANSSHFANVMWRRTQLGNQPEPSYLATPAGLERGAALQNWGSGHKLSGKAGFALTLAENSKQSAYKGQQARPRHVIRGLKVYDWRLDSTRPGGAGPHRLDEPATWTYSANPILWAVKWILGLWEGPTGGGAPQIDTQVGGMGVSIDNVDLAAFTEAANIAGSHGWTCAAWPSTDDDKAQVLDAFLQAGGAYYIQRGGKESCVHRAAPRVSVATISAADTAGPIELDTGASFTARKNSGVATYLSEQDGWKMTALGLVTSPQWVEEDGGRERSAPVTFSYVDQAKQAAELMCLAIAHTREGIRGRVPLRPYMQGIQPGAAFTITEPEFVLNGLKCLCLETGYDVMSGVHTVTFVSETDGKYAFAFGQTPNPPAPPSLEAVDPTFVTPPLPGDWTIVPRPPSGDGTQQPGFDLSGLVSNATATAVSVEWGPPPNPPPPDPLPEGKVFADYVDWEGVYQGPPDVERIPITGLQSGETYYIAVRYQRGSNFSERYVYGPLVAQTLIAKVDPAQLGDQIEAGTQALREAMEAMAGAQASLAALVSSANADFDGRIDALDSGLNGVQTLVDTQQTEIDGKASQSSLNGVINRVDTAESQIGSINTTLTGLDGRFASATSYNTLAAEVAAARGGFGSLSGRFTSQQQAIVDGLAGKASVSDFTSLQSTVSGQGSTLTAHNSRLSAVETSVAGKASASDLSSLSVVVSGKVTTYRQNEDPPNPNFGDILYKPNTNNQPFRYEGPVLGWVGVPDGRVAALQGEVLTLSGSITNLQSVTADLQTGKASVQSVTTAQATANDAKASATDALTLAASADGKASAARTVVTDVNDVITGTFSHNDGVRPGFWIMTDKFKLIPSTTGSSFSFEDGEMAVNASNGQTTFALTW